MTFPQKTESGGKSAFSAEKFNWFALIPLEFRRKGIAMETLTLASQTERASYLINVTNI